MIAITIFVVLGIILLSVLLFFLIKYNIKKFKEEVDTLNEKILSKSDINRSISSYIKKVGPFGDFTLIYIDIDNFGNLNDVFGHEQCDDFLYELSVRFTKRLPYHTVISKYNNDEFLIFIKENLSYENACKVCEQLLNDVKQKMYVSTTESVVLTASAGICLYPSCGKTLPDLIKNLELATYISKREGGSKYTVYYNSLAKEESNNFKFFKEVKQAIQNKEFCLYYQPIIDLVRNELYGFEALMRWKHPERGVLSPNEFLNILDQSGDIYWVGKWGLELLTKMLSDCQKIMENGECHISLNLSIKQLTYETLADDLILVAKKASANPKNIILEIGGFAMFEKLDNVKQNLMKLRDFGFMTAVDGFELDYSTLTRIQKEPIDMIKLNRSFLSDTNSNDQIREKFVKMLTESASIAKRLVVSEGIETLDNVEYIKAQGIEYGQGYFFSRPLPSKDAIDYIRYRKWMDAYNIAEDGNNYNELVDETNSNIIEDTNDSIVTNNVADNIENISEETKEEQITNDDSKNSGDVHDEENKDKEE